MKSLAEASRKSYKMINLKLVFFEGSTFRLYDKTYEFVRINDDGSAYYKIKDEPYEFVAEVGLPWNEKIIKI